MEYNNLACKLYDETLALQSKIVNEALVKHYGNITAAAEELQINRGTVRKIIKEKTPIGLRKPLRGLSHGR